jgi:hypothetical protein
MARPTRPAPVGRALRRSHVPGSAEALPFALVVPETSQEPMVARLWLNVVGTHGWLQGCQQTLALTDVLTDVLTGARAGRHDVLALRSQG